jgi:hypothetical protein
MAPFNLDWEVVLWEPSEEIVATHTASSIWFVKVRSIAMNVEDHVRGAEANRCIRMGCTVIEHLFDGEVGVFGGLGLLVCNGAESHEESNVNTAGII